MTPTGEERTVLAHVWLGRARAEARASRYFEHVERILERHGAGLELVAIARRAVEDERRHAAICHAVATAFAGRELPEPEPAPGGIPAFRRFDRELRPILQVVAMCCVNETIAGAFFELCRRRTTGTLAWAALRALAADEIDHARVGWAFVASLPPAWRARVAAALPCLVESNLAAWRDGPPRVGRRAALEAHGVPAWEDVQATARAAVHDLVIPGIAFAVSTAGGTGGGLAAPRREDRRARGGPE